MARAADAIPGGGSVLCDLVRRLASPFHCWFFSATEVDLAASKADWFSGTFPGGQLCFVPGCDLATV